MTVNTQTVKVERMCVCGLLNHKHYTTPLLGRKIGKARAQREPSQGSILWELQGYCTGELSSDGCLIRATQYQASGHFSMNEEALTTPHPWVKSDCSWRLLRQAESICKASGDKRLPASCGCLSESPYQSRGSCSQPESLPVPALKPALCAGQTHALPHR